MSPKKKPSAGNHPLRQKAETALTTTRTQVKKMTLEEVQHLVHELQVHQIELEMQNEELRQTQLELEVAHDRYATLFDSTPVGYVTLDGNGRILEANLTLCRLVGVFRKDILHKKFEQYVDPDDQRAFHRYLDFLRQTSGTHRSNVLTLQHSNTPHRVRLEGYLETREPSDVESLFRIAVEDVTIQEQIEITQGEPKALMAVVMGGVMDAIVTVDDEQRVVLFNQAAEDMFRCPASSALGQSISRFIPERFRADHRKHIQEFGRNPEPFRHMGSAREIFGLRADGEEFPIEATISQVQVKEKGKKLFTVVLRDVTERRHTQETLKKEQQFIAAILDTAGALVVVMNRHGQIVRFNRACEQLTGFSCEEVRDKPVWEILQLPLLGVEEVKEYFQTILQGRAPTLQENYWVTKKKKKRRWIAWSHAALRDDHGKVDFVIVTGIDLTEQRNAQRALKNEQRFIANVLNTTGALVIILDPQWQILRINLACEQMVRHAFQDLEGQPFWNLLTMSGEDETGARHVLESYRIGRLPGTFESAILDKASRLRWIQWNTTASYTKNGKVEYLIVTGTDITGRRHTERLLQQNEEQLQAILDHSPISIFLKDLDGRYLKVNQQFEKNFGMPEREVVGKTDLEIFPAKQAAHFCEGDQTVFQAGEAYECEEMSSRSDGIHTEHVFKFLVRNPKGIPYALCGIATDITQRKQAETILQEASQRLEIQQQELRLLAAQLLTAQEEERRRISRDLHDDINQRLALLSFKLQTAQKNLPDIHPVTHMLQELYENVADLSDDIRRIAYQYHSSILDDLGLSTALRSLCEDYEKWEGMTVTWELPAGAKKFSQAVGTCLYRVAQESLRNISKHAQASKVHLELREYDQGVTLSIRDNGKGFEVNQFLSHGLGFVSMRERVRLVDGTLLVDSQPGHGTTVRVSVPGNAQS